MNTKLIVSLLLGLLLLAGCQSAESTVSEEVAQAQPTVAENDVAASSPTSTPTATPVPPTPTPLPPTPTPRPTETPTPTPEPSPTPAPKAELRIRVVDEANGDPFGAARVEVTGDDIRRTIKPTDADGNLNLLSLPAGSTITVTAGLFYFHDTTISHQLSEGINRLTVELIFDSEQFLNHVVDQREGYVEAIEVAGAIYGGDLDQCKQYLQICDRGFTLGRSAFDLTNVPSGWDEVMDKVYTLRPRGQVGLPLFLECDEGTVPDLETYQSALEYLNAKIAMLDRAIELADVLMAQ